VKFSVQSDYDLTRPLAALLLTIPAGQTARFNRDGDEFVNVYASPAGKWAVSFRPVGAADGDDGARHWDPARVARVYHDPLLAARAIISGEHNHGGTRGRDDASCAGLVPAPTA
jgi:hypothetical protein